MGIEEKNVLVIVRAIRRAPGHSGDLGYVYQSIDGDFVYEVCGKDRRLDGWKTIQGALAALMKDLRDDVRGEFDFELKSPVADYAKRAGQTMASVVMTSRKGTDDVGRMLGVVALPEAELAALFAHAYELGYKHAQETR